MGSLAVAPPPLMNTFCPSESLIPPEAGRSQAPPRFEDSPDYFDDAEHGTPHPTIDWHPDQAPAGRLIPEESLRLETRGTSSHARSLSAPGIAANTQAEFWHHHTIQKATIAAKLRSIGELELAQKLEDCHTHHTIAVCDNCGTVKRFPNRCDLFCCPRCQPHLAHERKKQIEWWAVRQPQGKMVTLTVKNIPDISEAHVDEFRGWWTKLRRRKFARNWIGGFYSLELSWARTGWHLHLHALINARWIDKPELSRQWESITGGLGYIVDVKDARANDYLHEVCKYIVKGSRLAKWSPRLIQQFVHTFAGKRCFGVFGDLYGARTEFAEWIATLKSQKPKCECGCATATFYTESEWILANLVPNTARPASRAHAPPEACFPFHAQFLYRH